ncbi:MAG: efflux RND transporter permease subunit [Opitutales bacterium]|nr:efflux RND transporter permease subunit [Opitutales bacterium]
MIERLIDASIRNRALVLLLAVAVAALGMWSMRNLTVDAIPDLSDVQVVVVTEFPGQAPQVVENQVTNPLARALLAVPDARDVRGYSMFGVSFVYVLFEDGTDLYWARARVLEQLSTIAPRLPDTASAQLGPDATGVGWVYQYVLTTGLHSPEFPNGFWHDPLTDTWFTAPDELPNDPATRDRLVRFRVFPENGGRTTCPVSGVPLQRPDIDLSELRGLQDWFLRYELTAVRGVSEIATVGGFEKQYQVTVDPAVLLAYGLTFGEIADAIRASNLDTGGRSLEISETQYMVRSRGYLGTLDEDIIADLPTDGISLMRARTRQVREDLASIPLGVGEGGVPILLGEIARIDVGPEIRQGMVDWNGEGETVGGIVIMRFGENARDTIARVKDRLQGLEAALPAGVGIEVGYDRSDLIDRSIATLSNTLLKEMLAVTLVMILFLLHVRSALVAALVLPSAVLMSLTAMQLMGINANIMSLGGIAIAIGVMVDCSIVMVENAHKHLEAEKAAAREGRATRTQVEVVSDAAREVGPTLFFSLLVITISFLPIFILGEQSGRLFKPLAYTKTFAMAAASVLAVTLTPVLMVYFVKEHVLPERWAVWRRWLTLAAIALIPAVVVFLLPLEVLLPWRGWIAVGWILLVLILFAPQRIPEEDKNPVTRILETIYAPFLALSIRFRLPLLLASVAAVAVTLLWPLRELGTEFMPPLEEGDLLYMPTTVEPGLSYTKAVELLQQTDKLIAAFPEVVAVKGKIGRAESATDPAPFNMIETTITLHRDMKQWRHVPRPRFFTNWPSWMRWAPAKVFSESRPITMDELIYGFELPDGSRHPGLDSAVQIPGLANAWTMPIRARIDMLSTGFRTPVGIKFMGTELGTLADLARRAEQIIATDPELGPFTTSAFAERAEGGKYLDITPDRAALARYNLSMVRFQEVIAGALGGMPVTETIEGLDRYSVNLRYPRELRDNLPMLRQLLVDTPTGAQVPLGDLASLGLRDGPSMIRSENARPSAWVYIDIADIDVGTYVERARRLIERELPLPPGYSLVWSGQFEYIQSARAQFMVAIPLTLIGIVLLLYLATRSWARVLLIFLTLSFSVIGAIWFLWLLDYNLSVAVVVGIIALLGLDAETSLIMLLYLDTSYEKFKKEGRLTNRNALWQAVYHGAVQRIRPKTMTVVTTIAGLLPLLFATGAGADTMSRLAAPMIGGLLTSFLLELLIYPAIYYQMRLRELKR